MDIAKALNGSALKNAQDACAALQDGWSLVIDEGRALCSNMKAIYKGRHEWLQQMRGHHAAQLAASVEEFIKSLESNPSGEVVFAALTGNQEHSFKLFLLAGTDVILGCMRTVSKGAVSPESWEELWG